ncbi:hypothetical protein [Achromobacter phage Motura]|uniref:Uncharacterized protein n=1 Tax=Achromobacter phage Motura TaxID=2591403 RepID=A0A514CSL0_9CAUD|nr:hypothetical protein H1O15_gp048 [Achromobacter phage Motura]QDH83456.1 hypothetical protein [Achromobacter phage Motura]
MEKSTRINWSVEEQNLVAGRLFVLWNVTGDKPTMNRLLDQAQREVLPSNRWRNTLSPSSCLNVMARFNKLAGFPVGKDHSSRKRVMSYAWTKEECEVVADFACEIITSDGLTIIGAINQAQSILGKTNKKVIRQANDVRSYAEHMAPVFIKRGFGKEWQTVADVLNPDRDPLSERKAVENWPGVRSEPIEVRTLPPVEDETVLAHPGEPLPVNQMPESIEAPKPAQVNQDLVMAMVEAMRPQFDALVKNAAKAAFMQLTASVPALMDEMFQELAGSPGIAVARIPNTPAAESSPAKKRGRPRGIANKPKPVYEGPTKAPDISTVERQDVVIAGFRGAHLSPIWDYLELRYVEDSRELLHEVDTNTILIHMTDGSFTVTKEARDAAGTYHACRMPVHNLKTLLTRLNNGAALEAAKKSVRTFSE